MILSELREWVNSLPEKFDEFTVVNGEIGIIDEQYHYRVDKPLTTLTVDEETQEVIFMNDHREGDDNIELPEDIEADKIIAALKSDEFLSAFRKQIEDDTWGQGVPMYYMDEEGWLVEHHKDGTINKLKQLR
jgi:hypothetical protein